MNISIKLDTPVEFINITPVNPLISKCEIKVCYVGETPNRNKTIITKEVAKEMANSLPGSPIVGFFNFEAKDYEEHNRALQISNGILSLKETTRPYGFVDLGAKVWFQKFLDNGIEHEYLMTEGYLWTGQYPECQRVIETGNNQSMELDEDTMRGTFTKGRNGQPEFFIVNEAIFSKLCILGENYEPCFEGATITAPTVQFSLEEDFKQSLYSMMAELKELLNEGGVKEVLDNENVQTPEEEVETVEETVETPEEEVITPEEEEVVTEPEVEAEPVVEEEVEAEAGEDLATKYSRLEENYNTLLETNQQLNTELIALRKFKLESDREAKKSMIANFYMLTNEDKKDVLDNIDNYSLEEIESKLSVICYRNKVNFSLQDNTQPELTSVNVESVDVSESVPDWLKAVRTVAKNMN